MTKTGNRKSNPKEPRNIESNNKTRFPQDVVPPVPEIQGKAKTGNAKAEPIIK